MIFGGLFFELTYEGFMVSIYMLNDNDYRSYKHTLLRNYVNELFRKTSTLEKYFFLGCRRLC